VLTWPSCCRRKVLAERWNQKNENGFMGSRGFAAETFELNLINWNDLSTQHTESPILNPPNTMSPADVKKIGTSSCHPATALLIGGSKPDPRRVWTGSPDQRSQGRRGCAHSSLSSGSPAWGRPTCRIKEPTRVASRGIPSRESFRALGPQRTGPSPT
jgi:hypothetical protein